MGYGVDGWQRWEIVPFCTEDRLTLETNQLPVKWVLSLFPGGKVARTQSWRHRGQECWSYTSMPQYVLL
jgi:hypothetical protein